MSSDPDSGNKGRGLKVSHDALLTLIGTLMGGMIAVIGGFAAAWWQSRAALEADASTSASDFTVQGYGVRVTLNNDGLSGVTVKSADLLLDDRVVARAAGHVGDPKAARASLPFRANVASEMGAPASPWAPGASAPSPSSSRAAALRRIAGRHR